MSTVLKAAKREAVGSRQSRKLRTQGRIPASVQAEGEAPHIDISFEEAPFLAARRHHEHVYDLDIDGAHETALIRELQWDVFGDKILHVEFRRVDLKKKTEVEVEIEFTGQPKGILNHVLTHVTLSAKPEDIPDSVELKVEGSVPGDHMTAADLILPPGVTLACEPETQVANISEIRAEAEPEAEEAEPVDGESPGTAPADEPPSEG